MADHSYSTIATYNTGNFLNDPGTKIRGDVHQAANTYLLQSISGKLFDATKPYKTGQTVIYNDGTFGYEWWKADSDLAAAAWNSASFTRLTRRTQKVTASTAAYTGIELGTKTYNHSFGHVDFTIQAFESTGAIIPLNVSAKSTTTFTIISAANYANAVIYLQEIVIP